MRRSMSIVTVLALLGSMLGATAALAQDGPSVQSGITVTGYGEATAPAESANLQLLIINEESFYGGPPQAPQVEATPGAAARSTVAPIVEAIEASESVESVEVVLPLVTDFYGGPAPVARIDVAVSNPDLAMLTGLITGATQAAAEERLLVGRIGASFETSDCQALETEARQSALDDARSRAGIQAGVLGVSLGEVISSVDVDVTGLELNVYGLPVAPDGSCAPPVSSGNAGAVGPGITLPTFDPTSDSGEVEVYRQVQVTFAIDVAGATPAS